MRKRKKDFREYVADFETTTIDEIKEDSKTEVWAAAICELDSGDSKVFNSMEKFMDYVKKLGLAKIGFHNLKFDGSFIVMDINIQSHLEREDMILQRKPFQH